MTDPQKIRIEDYSYELPDEKIARFPLENRDESKLLIYKDGNISESVFKNIVDVIPDNSLLIFNDTKVIQARIIFEKPGSKSIEILCLEPFGQSIEQALQSKHNCDWTAMVGNLRKWKHDTGEKLSSSIKTVDYEFTLSAEYLRRDEDNHIILFSWDTGIAFSDVLASLGEMPIPPYLKREAEDSDKTRYQTVYAEQEGSVAAPTAGLHFTDEILSSLNQKGIETAKVTLHVGAGTFKPVKSELIGDHIMHNEFVTIPRATIDALSDAITRNMSVICVGTTSLRTVESLPYIADNILDNKADTGIEQFQPYFSQNTPINAQKALEILKNHLKTTQNEEISAQTGIMIVPGFKFVFTDVLLTNFHQPKSTLLLLIAAFLGDDWKKAYEYALQNNFRFLSYGDSSILFRN